MQRKNIFVFSFVFCLLFVLLNKFLFSKIDGLVKKKKTWQHFDEKYITFVLFFSESSQNYII